MELPRAVIPASVERVDVYWMLRASDGTCKAGLRTLLAGDDVTTVNLGCAHGDHISSLQLDAGDVLRAILKKCPDVSVSLVGRCSGRGDGACGAYGIARARITYRLAPLTAGVASTE
ncbi:MAG: hypothetical protein ACXVAM_17375 [Vulcanimicrobiaceae bacterium]